MITVPSSWDLGDDLPDGLGEADIRRLIHDAASTAPLRGPYFDILNRALGDPLTLPADILPAWQDVLDLATKAKSVPADYIVHHLLGAASGVLAGVVDVQVRPGWVEPSMLFTVNIGDAGSGKSPATDVVDLRRRVSPRGPATPAAPGSFDVLFDSQGWPSYTRHSC